MRYLHREGLYQSLVHILFKDKRYYIKSKHILFQNVICIIMLEILMIKFVTDWQKSTTHWKDKTVLPKIIIKFSGSASAKIVFLQGKRKQDNTPVPCRIFHCSIRICELSYLYAKIVFWYLLYASHWVGSNGYTRYMFWARDHDTMWPEW